MLDRREGLAPRAFSMRRLVSGEPMEATAEARQCEQPSCRTRLSRYNPSSTCAAHAGWADPPRPARGTAKES